MAAGRGSHELTTDLIRVMSRTERLALARTLMANQRTVLSYAKTCIGLLAAGFGLLALAGHQLLQAAGVAAATLSLITGVAGFVRYRAMKRALGHVTASHLVDVGYSLLQEEAATASDDASAAS
jgi:putative membrane protein